ncbi:MAG TPA: carbon-nitrogen hydrolase family protein [Candidatus Thermoplasmatota archaeon]
MRILGAQWRPKTGDTATNLKAMTGLVAKEKPDLALFPEMWLTGYTLRDRVIELAEPADGPSVEAVSKAARRARTTVVFGFPEKARGHRGAIYNAAAVCTPDGEVGVFRKWFLPNFGPYEEKLFFHKGHGIPVFETPFGTLGLQICYDLFFPELAKVACLKGADLVANISSSPVTARSLFQQIIHARAVENAVFFAYVNRVGTDLGLVFAGGSALVGPRGDTVAELPLIKQGLIDAEVELGDTDLARPFRPTLRDSRPEVFEEAAHLLRGSPKR